MYVYKYIWYGLFYVMVISCNVTYCNVMDYDIPILGAQISIESMPGAAKYAECVADEGERGGNQERGAKKRGSQMG